MKKSDLKQMFEYNQFKIRILDEKVGPNEIWVAEVLVEFKLVLLEV